MKISRNPKVAGARRRVLLVDDHPITRYGLAQLINQQTDLVVCGEAETAQQALVVVAAARPDLVLADITLPGRSGLELIKDLQCERPEIPILVMSMHDESLYAERVLRAGGRGYIMKNEGGEKLLEAARQVLRGEVYVSNRVSAAILDNLTRRQNSQAQPRPGVLSDREFEVFQLIGQGLSSEQIAQRLNLSAKTIATHRAHIKAKLNLRTAPQLIKEAIRWAATEQLV